MEVYFSFIVSGQRRQSLLPVPGTTRLLL